jgi:hypothetical protein
VDDISGEQSNDKQFITVVTKSGNYFYLVIDRADDKENIHFLNLVDEADLLAIIEADKKPAPAPAPVEATEPEPEPAPEPEKSNAGSILTVLLVLGALGGGAFYYFKIYKPKQDAQGPAVTELDEFEFDADEDELDGEAANGGRLPDSAEPDGETDGTDGDAPDFAEDGEPVPDFTFDTGDKTPESEGK